jgi:hypothetical protein
MSLSGGMESMEHVKPHKPIFTILQSSSPGRKRPSWLRSFLIHGCGALIDPRPMCSNGKHGSYSRCVTCLFRIGKPAHGGLVIRACWERPWIPAPSQTQGETFRFLCYQEAHPSELCLQ